MKAPPSWAPLGKNLRSRATAVPPVYVLHAEEHGERDDVVVTGSTAAAARAERCGAEEGGAEAAQCPARYLETDYD